MPSGKDLFVGKQYAQLNKISFMNEEEDKLKRRTEDLCNDEEFRILHTYEMLSKIHMNVFPSLVSIADKLKVENSEGELVDTEESRKVEALYTELQALTTEANDWYEPLNGEEKTPIAGDISADKVFAEGPNVTKEDSKKHMIQINRKMKKLLLQSLDYIEKDTDKHMRDYLMQRILFADHVSRHNNFHREVALNPMLYNFQQMDAVNLKDSSDPDGPSYHTSSLAFMGFPQGEKKEQRNGDLDQQTKYMKIYSDFYNLKFAQNKQLELEIKRQRLSEKHWPGNTKAEYIESVKEENNKIINSFKRLKSVVDKYGNSPFDPYCDNPISYITGESNKTDREMSRAIGYLEGVNFGLDHGWDPDEVGVPGLVGSIRGEINRKKNEAEVLIAATEKTMKDPGFDESLRENLEEAIRLKREEAENIRTFEKDFNEVEKLLKDNAAPTYMEKKQVMDGLLGLTKKYHLEPQQEMKGLSECFTFMVYNPQVIRDLRDKIDVKAQKEYELNQLVENHTPYEFSYLARSNGWPNHRPLSDDTSGFLRRLSEVVSGVKKNMDSYKEVGGKIEENARRLIEIEKEIMTKQLNGLDGMKNIIKEVSKIYKTRHILNVTEKDIEKVTALENKVELIPANSAVASQMNGIDENRMSYLRNVLNNMKDDKNKMFGHTDATDYTKMVNCLEDLVNMGPENKLSAGLRRDYYEKKKETMKAAKDYLQRVGFDTSLRSAGTNRKNAAIMAIALIDPVNGERAIAKANDSRWLKRWTKIDMEKMKEMEGVGKAFGGNTPSVRAK